MASGIYAIRNALNGHEYIGQSVNALGRWRLHRSCLNRGKHHSPHLQFAWNKYGSAAFEFVPLATDDAPWTKQELANLEQDYVDFFVPEYNICRECVTSLLGVKFTPEHCARIGAKNHGKTKSPEHRAKLAAAHRGMTHSLETRAKISAAQRGVPHSPETRARISAALKGRVPWNKRVEGQP